MSPSTNETSAIVSVWSCPAVPTAVLPPNPSLIFDSFCQDQGTCPRALFFRATTFPLIARMPCGATVHTLPQTPSQVMPAAHRHICSSPRYSSTAHKRWRERGERVRVSGLFQKKKKKWAVLLSKNFPCIAVKRRTQGNCQEQKVGERSQHVNSSDMVYVIFKIETSDKLISVQL